MTKTTASIELSTLPQSTLLFLLTIPKPPFSEIALLVKDLLWPYFYTGEKNREPPEEDITFFFIFVLFFVLLQISYKTTYYTTQP